MKLSVVIPAYNEEKLITGCLLKVSEAFAANAAADWTGEIIVVDNNSSDRTAELARAAGGDWLLFVDADSWLSAGTLAEMLDCLRRGRHAGGGCLIGLDDAPRVAKLFIVCWNFISRTVHWAAGSFVFCRSDAFRDTGGFSTDLYATEEIRFTRDLKRWAEPRGYKFTILQRHPHVSSGRKFHLYSRGEIVQVCLRSLFRMHRTLRDPGQLALFYDGRR